MRIRIRDALFMSAMIAVAACAEGTNPKDPAGNGRKEIAAAPPVVRISEVHYDNTGTDTGEAIEVSGPAGMDVSGWTVVLYNGNGGASYNTQTLSGAIPATTDCDGRGVLVLTYPSNGIQNGPPDGIALVDASGTSVVEFLSYEGTFAATDGPAAGITSTDIGVLEAGTEPVGQSLQRDAAGAWSGPKTSTFGMCNDAGEPPPPPPAVASVTVAPATATIVQGATQAFTASAFDAANQPISGVTFTWTSSATAIASVNASGLATGIGAGDANIVATAPNGVSGSGALHVNVTTPPPDMPDTRFSELHYDNLGTDANEAIEIEGPAGTDLTGWSIVLYDGTVNAMYNTQMLTGTIPALCNGRGVVAVNYPANGIQNGGNDGLALVDAAGHVVEFLSYEGTLTPTDGPAAGMLSTDIIASESSAAVGLSLQRDEFNRWQAATASFGACNVPGEPPPMGNTVSFSGRTPTDPALPIGFQAQIFATVRDANNVVVPTTITWSSEAPTMGSVDQNGVITALAEGTMTFRATAADGVTTGTYSLPSHVALASTTAEYVGNTEFGDPTDSDPSDDFILRHAEYTTSYNVNRGTPNWVSYDLEVTHFGDQDRCNCFTFDPDLPASFPRYTTADYTGSGAFHGYGIDRGHLTRSFDRTSAQLDNAFTFLFSNVVPQAADLNQGPWAIFESYLGDLARFSDKEVYIVTGVAGNKGTLKNEGKIVIPTSTWKVAVIMPRNEGLADIVDYRDLEVIAVNMPNEPGVRNVPWETYKTTVDAIEALSGYDLLALLPDGVEAAVESATQPPIGNTDGPYAQAEGSEVTMSAANSVDPNGSVVSYDWSFGDGTTGTGAVVTHTYAQDGAYTVRVIVTDNDGLTATVFTTVNVSNVAPVLGELAAAPSLLPRESYTLSGSFTDPGADAWTATVNWGDGSAATSVALAGRSFSLSHAYAAAGTFTVTVQISDDDTTATRSQTVTVIAPAQAVQTAIGLVDGLVAAGKLSRVMGQVIKIELGVAQLELGRGHPAIAAVTLRVVVAQLDALVSLGRLSAADAAPLRTLLTRVIQSIS